MTSDEFNVEILAQAIWRQAFGEKTILKEWQDWSAANGTEAQAFRDKAKEMLSIAPSGSHHSLGWIYH